MAKISNILPSSPRITNVDVANERPVRSGMPSFGQPIAPTSNPKDEFRRITGDIDVFSAPTYNSSGILGAAAESPVLDSKRETEIAEETTRGFFGSPASATSADVIESDEEDTIVPLQESDVLAEEMSTERPAQQQRVDLRI